MSQIALRDYLQEAENAISAGHVDDALSRCQHILAQFPELLEAQRLLGEIYLAQDKLEEARHAFDWVLTNDPENVVTYCDRALISERMSDYDTALDCYQQAYELSRGNSQIRHEFNKLSAKVGQQGFMFSRAGLARLYMRGDLLTQAMQEWEAVLAVSPDRLDARTGLLETYWRAGLYDRVEQLASQILEDVPGCLKALLLLAAVTAPKNIARTQELLQQVKALDPDLVTAQELFADRIAAQPNDQFLRLLQQPAVQLEKSEPQDKRLPSSPSNASPYEDLLSSSSNGSGSWSSSNVWGNGSAAASSSFVPTSPQPEESDLPIWAPSSILGLDAQPKLEPNILSSSNSGIEQAEPWQSLEQSLLEQRPAQNPHVDEFPTLHGSSTLEKAPWEDLPTIHESSTSEKAPWEDLPTMYEDATPEHASWEGLENLSSESLAGVDLWQGEHSHLKPAESPSGSWNMAGMGNDASAPPSWLNMLTQQERRELSEGLQPAEAAPKAEPAPQKEEPATSMPVPPAPSGSIPVLPAPASPTPKPAASLPVPPAPAPAQKKQSEPDFAAIIPPLEEEESSFGPEWLKALGATTIEAEDAPPASSTPLAPVADSTPPVVEEQPQVNQAADAATERERKLLSTLEEIEQSIRAQGFVSHEPHSLSTLAQSSHDNERENTSLETNSAQRLYQDVDLSSALAELGNLMPQEETRSQTAREADSSPAPSQPALEEPEWMAALRAFPTPQPSQEQELPEWALALNSTTPSTPAPVEEPEQEEPQREVPEWMAALQAGAPSIPQEAPRPTTPSPIWEDLPILPTYQEQQPASRTHAASQEMPQPAGPASPRPVPEPVAQAFVASTPPPVLLPAPRPDPLLDNELETTMKRPAVRLQHLQSRPTTPQRGQPGERTASKAPASQGNSYRERLVKGYQLQLAGDYDEAMQEYRIIIKNAPDLLGEVVSNVRALLKLAPKYAAGYRVLGDAYMRQGEYLQAMESYNKALTMAKKAKS